MSLVWQFRGRSKRGTYVTGALHPVFSPLPVVRHPNVCIVMSVFNRGLRTALWWKRNTHCCGYHSSRFTRTVPVVWVLKNLLPAVLPDSVRNAKCPGFSQFIKIWHFWQCAWTFLVSHSGRKHLQDSHQQATDRKWEEEKDEDVYVRDYSVWTEAAKDEELICSGIPRGGVGVQTPSEIPKALQNHAKLNPIVKGRQHPKMFWKKGSKILKLPRFAIVLH